MQLSVSGPGERIGNTHQGSTASGNARMHNGDIHVHAGNVNYMCDYGRRSDRAVVEDDRSVAFMEALSFPLMERRLASIRRAPGGTCRWIFAKPGFSNWLGSSGQSSQNDIFWIKGKAGAGKSTLMRCIFETARERMPGRHVISFFFNAKGVRLEHSVEGMFRSLLYQILEKVPRLRELISIPRRFHDGQDWEPEILRDIFRTAVLGTREEKVVCIIDALDETSEEDARQVVGFFEDLLEEAQSQDTALKICFASRLFPHIAAKACREMIIEDQDEHSHDIKSYIWGFSRHTGKEALREVARCVPLGFSSSGANKQAIRWWSTEGPTHTDLGHHAGRSLCSSWRHCKPRSFGRPLCSYSDMGSRQARTDDNK